MQAKFLYSFIALSFFFLGISGCKTTNSTQKNVPKVIEKTNSNKQKIDELYVDACTDMICGNPKGAKEQFKQVLEIDPRHHASMYNIAKLSLEAATETKDFDEAITMGENAIKLDPNNYWYYVTVVEAYRMKGDFLNAIRLQNTAVQRFPKQSDAISGLAELYLKNKQYDEALDTYKKIEAKFGISEERLSSKYKLYMEIGKQEEAFKTIEELIKLNPTKTEYYTAKYSLLLKQNKDKEAVELLKKLLSINPNDGVTMITLADYYKSQGNMEESDKYLFQTFENPEVFVKGKLNIVQAIIKEYKDTEMAARARKLVKIMATVHPNTTEALELQGDIFDLDNKPDSAWTMYKRAVDLEPRNDKVWIKLLNSSNKSQNYNMLISDANDALEYFPNNEMIQYFYALANLKQGDYTLSINQFEKIKKRTSSADLLTLVSIGLGESYYRNSAFDKSDNAFEEALLSAPNNDLIFNSYAFFSAYRKDKLPNAKEMIEKALQVKPNNPTYQYTYGWVFYQMNDNKSAIEWFEKAVKNSIKPNAEILEHLGDAYYKEGQKELAVEQWNKANAVGNKKINVAQKLAQNP
jgi:tetratricopeptide (TPR) repeat protein